MPRTSKPSLNENIRNTLFLDGIPQVPESKLPAFQKFLFKHKAFTDLNINPADLEITVENGKTVGCGFLTFDTPEEAEAALSTLDKLPIDKKHVLRTTTFEEFDNLMSPEGQSMSSSSIDAAQETLEKSHLRNWLLDEKLRDQFVVRRDKETEVFWHDPFRLKNKDGRELFCGGEKQKANGEAWTRQYVQWSSQGSYLATFHDQGIMLWGGEGMDEVGKFPHPKVQFIDFSPCETYLMTFSNDDQGKTIIWDILLRKKKREFEGRSKFKWSFDDKYFARVTENKVQIYETPLMRLKDNSSIKADRVYQLEFSPSSHLLAYWCSEQAQSPATITILDANTKNVVREQHVFTNSHMCPKRVRKGDQGGGGERECSPRQPCNDCKITFRWQSKSEYLAVKVCKRKTKRNATTSYHIFRTTVKGTPVETLVVPEKKEEMGQDRTIFMAWEPNGHRFAIAAGPAGGDVDISFYKIQATKIKDLVTLEKKKCNEIHWSPRGGIVVLAGTGPLNGELEFYDVTYKESIVKSDHYLCNSVEWDPSGRFLCTAVTTDLALQGHQMENGYKMWKMDGTVLAKVRLNACYQVLWRPRPQKLFSPEELKAIRSSVKSKYWDQFSQEDEKIELANLSEGEKKKKLKEADWRKYREERMAWYRRPEISEERRKLREYDSDADEEWEEIEQQEEEELEYSEEVISTYRPREYSD